jgi:hypothetical protein
MHSPVRRGKSRSLGLAVALAFLTAGCLQGDEPADTAAVAACGTGYAAARAFGTGLVREGQDQFAAAFDQAASSRSGDLAEIAEKGRKVTRQGRVTVWTEDLQAECEKLGLTHR